MELEFAIENFSSVEDVESDQFAVIEVYIVSDGNNRHDMPISLKTIKKAAQTLKNKYIVAGFDGIDFEGHEPDQKIIGHFPESTKISYKKKDEKTFLVAEALLSKVYADWAYEQFVNQERHGVSMEITVTEMGDEDNDGKQEIKEFVFNGVTILGDDHTPAIDGADALITKFSVEDAAEFYGKYSWKSNKVAKTFVASMSVEKGEEGVDKMEEKKELEKIFDIEEIEAEISEDESDEEVVMENEDDMNKVSCEDSGEDKHDDEEDNDDEDEEFEEKVEEEVFEETKSLTANQIYTILNTACEEKFYGWLETYDDEYVYCYRYDKGHTYRHKYTLNGKEAEIMDDGERVMRGGYVTFTEDEKDILTYAELLDKNNELKSAIKTYEDSQKNMQVETILASVLDVLSSEEIDDLREESKDFSLDNLNAFSNKVKALAFESVSVKEDTYAFTKTALNEMSEHKNTGKYSW